MCPFYSYPPSFSTMSSRAQVKEKDSTRSQRHATNIGGRTFFYSTLLHHFDSPRRVEQCGGTRLALCVDRAIKKVALFAMRRPRLVKVHGYDDKRIDLGRSTHTHKTHTHTHTAETRSQKRAGVCTLLPCVVVRSDTTFFSSFFPDFSKRASESTFPVY